MRFLVRLLLFLLVIIVAVPAALVVALNSKAGREFVVTQVNQRSGGMLRLNGLGGHFPADIKLAGFTMADQHGVWLTGSNLELRWRPQALAGTRILGFTAAAPAAPYIAPISVTADRLSRLRSALDAALHDRSLAYARDDLFIDGFSHLDFADYSMIAHVETEAIAHGYPELA